MRTLPAGFQTALESDVISPTLLAYFDFSGDPLYAWTGPSNITFDPGDGLGSKTWLGLHGAATFDALQETSDTRIVSLRASLQYIPNETLPNLNTVAWKDREARVYLALMDPDDLSTGPIGAVEFFRGSMDTLAVDVGETHSMATLNLVNELVRMRQSWGAVYSDASQAIHGDTSMRFLPSIQNVKIPL